MTVMARALLKITSADELDVREPVPSATGSRQGLPLSALSCRYGLRRARVAATRAGWGIPESSQPPSGPGATIPRQV